MIPGSLTHFIFICGLFKIDLSPYLPSLLMIIPTSFRKTSIIGKCGHKILYLQFHVDNHATRIGSSQG